MLMPGTETFYVRFRGQTRGPIDRESLLEQARAGRITSLHEVSADQVSWTRLRDWQGLHDATRSQPIAPKR